jgi:hypothetical protein
MFITAAVAIVKATSILRLGRRVVFTWFVLESVVISDLAGHRAIGGWRCDIRFSIGPPWNCAVTDVKPPEAGFSGLALLPC